MNFESFDRACFASDNGINHIPFNHYFPGVFFFSDDEDFASIQFNEIDKKSNCDRQSHHGAYQFFVVKVNENKTVQVPRNPVGRTGLTGRGHLGRWGVNHAADPIVTTFVYFKIVFLKNKQPF